MKISKIIKYILIAIASIILIVTLGLFVWSKTGTYPARSIALTNLESTDRVTITQNDLIVFTPSEQNQTGLIFYPGGLVEPTAYAPILRQIAEEGLLVVITPMPFNLAIFDTGAAETVIAKFPEITTWILAGHSLGGASAAIFAENHPDSIAALALWDSYPPGSADLSNTNLTVISVYGTTDNFPNTDNFNDQKYLLPANTIFTPIEGASHAQFGDYGPQKGDIVPVLSLAEQHKLVAEIMIDFIRQQQ